MGDCLGFVTGPGVQCVINVTWQRLSWNAVGNGPWSPTLAPAMILYGVDPDELGIRYLQVDNLGIADSALGSLNGDTVVFRMSCVNQDADMRSCTRDVRMSVSPDGRTIRMAIDVTFRPSMLVLDLKVNIRLLLERLQQMEPE